MESNSESEEMNNKLQDYQVVDTLGKSVPELIVKVYNGAIGSLRQAADYYKDEDFQLGYEKMERAKKFIVHLYTTLDEEKGGDIAKNLSKLYAFIIEQINFVQATKDVSLIEDCVTVLNNIREGWVQLAENLKNKGTDEQPEEQPHSKLPAKSVSISV